MSAGGTGRPGCGARGWREIDNWCHGRCRGEATLATKDRAVPLPVSNSPGRPLLTACAVQNSPSTPRPTAFPQKNSPSTPENSVFRPFWACRANFFALAPTPGRAGRNSSRAGRRNMETMKPTTPLLALNKAPLKPASPLRPKTAPKSPISHPQRRWQFQSHTDTSEQRRSRFQPTGPPHLQHPHGARGRARLRRP